jgi:hypothetical protein
VVDVEEVQHPLHRSVAIRDEVFIGDCEGGAVHFGQQAAPVAVMLHEQVLAPPDLLQVRVLGRGRTAEPSVVPPPARLDGPPVRNSLPGRVTAEQMHEAEVREEEAQQLTW